METTELFLSQNRDGKKQFQKSVRKAEFRRACFSNSCQVCYLFFPGIIIPDSFPPDLCEGAEWETDSEKGLFVPGFINIMPVINQNGPCYAKNSNETLPILQTVKRSYH